MRNTVIYPASTRLVLATVDQHAPRGVRLVRDARACGAQSEDGMKVPEELSTFIEDYWCPADHRDEQNATADATPIITGALWVALLKLSNGDDDRAGRAGLAACAKARRDEGRREPADSARAHGAGTAGVNSGDKPFSETKKRPKRNIIKKIGQRKENDDAEREPKACRSGCSCSRDGEWVCWPDCSGCSPCQLFHCGSGTLAAKGLQEMKQRQTADPQVPGWSLVNPHAVRFTADP